MAVDFKEARWFNPLNGDITMADFDEEGIGISLRSGESMILQTYDEPIGGSTLAVTMNNAFTPHVVNANNQFETIPVEGPWTLSFIEESPKVNKTYQLDKLKTWETLDEQTRITMGTGVYTTYFKLSKKQVSDGSWMLDLGDVRESARVYINGQFLGCAWSVPFVLDTKGALKEGDNELRVEVTNLPANRIADLDRRGVKWRKMEEINVVDINYARTTYDQWEPMPSGLNTNVKLVRKP
jgi:hypothetical protein